MMKLRWTMERKPNSMMKKLNKKVVKPSTMKRTWKMKTTSCQGSTMRRKKRTSPRNSSMAMMISMKKMEWERCPMKMTSILILRQSETK